MLVLYLDIYKAVLSVLLHSNFMRETDWKLWANFKAINHFTFFLKWRMYMEVPSVAPVLTAVVTL